MQDIEERLIKVELTQSAHAGDLADLRAATIDFRMSLHKIEATLSQIKWFVIGAMAFYGANELGIGGIIKGFMG